MLTIVFRPRKSAIDTGWPSSADGSASVGKGSPEFRPFGSGLLRAQIGFGFAGAWPAAVVAATAASAQARTAAAFMGRL